MATENQITSHRGSFFEVGVRYDKTQKDGTQKKVTEKYVFDALSFSEAEEAVAKELQPYIIGEYKITSESLANYPEVVLSDALNADKFYKVRCAFITFDEKTEKEKRTTLNYLVQAKDILNAVNNLGELFRNSVMDYRIVSVSETKILDFFKYKPKDDDTEQKTATD